MEKDKKMITMYGIITLIVTIAQIIISQKRQLGMYEIQNLFTIVLVMTGILLLLCRRIKPPVIYVIIMLQLFVIIGIDIGVYQKGIIGENGKGITMHWATIWIAAIPPADTITGPEEDRCLHLSGSAGNAGGKFTDGRNRRSITIDAANVRREGWR